jgi:hypothetical protein
MDAITPARLTAIAGQAAVVTPPASTTRPTWSPSTWPASSGNGTDAVTVVLASRSATRRPVEL